MNTPRIIWQTWKTKDPETFPERVKEYPQRWKRLHMGYDYYLIDDDDLRKIVKKAVPEYLEDYDNFSHNIERVDFARYALLYLYGGVYADLDTFPQHSIEKWASKGTIVLGCEPREHANEMYKRDRVVCNALMISPPGHPFWKDLMEYITDHYEHNYEPVETTGPIAVTHFVDKVEGNGRMKKYPTKVIITDPCVFYPMLGTSKVSKYCDIRDSDVVHVWENSWVKPWHESPLRYNRTYWMYAFLLLFLILWFFFLFLTVRRRNDLQ